MLLHSTKPTPSRLRENDGFSQWTQSKIMNKSCFSHKMKDLKTKKRVSLEVSRSLHERIKQLANEREETMVSLVINVLQDFLESEHKIVITSNHASREYQAFHNYRLIWETPVIPNLNNSKTVKQNHEQPIRHQWSEETICSTFKCYSQESKASSAKRRQKHNRDCHSLNWKVYFIPWNYQIKWSRDASAY